MTGDPTEPAPQTGPQEGRCGAVRKRDPEGNPIRWCRKYPMQGQTRCALDGGKSPQALAAASRRQQEAAAAALAVTYGLPVEIDPVDALLGELWRTQGAVVWLQEQIRLLAPEALTWGVASVVDKGATEFTGVDRTEAAGITPLLEVYMRERKHLAQLSKDCVTVGIELRMEQRMKAVGSEFAEALRGALVALDALLRAGEITSVDPADPQVMQVVSTRLHALAGAA